VTDATHYGTTPELLQLAHPKHRKINIVLTTVFILLESDVMLDETKHYLCDGRQRVRRWLP
jgi:hypothetical protein